MKKYIVGLLLTAGISSCSNLGPATSAGNEGNNKKRLQQFYDEVFNAHNVAMIDSFAVTDVVDHNPEPPHSGKGIADLKAQFTEMFGDIPDVKVSTKFMIASGDTVVAYITISGTGAVVDSKEKSGKPFSMDGIDIVVIKDGKALERWGIFDTVTMMDQLGMLGGNHPADSASVPEIKAK